MLTVVLLNISIIKNKKTKDSSADEKFLLSSLPDREQMNQPQKRRFKREVMAVIVSIFEEPTTSTNFIAKTSLIE